MVWNLLVNINSLLLSRMSWRLSRFYPPNYHLSTIAGVILREAHSVSSLPYLCFVPVTTTPDQTVHSPLSHTLRKNITSLLELCGRSIQFLGKRRSTNPNQSVPTTQGRTQAFQEHMKILKLEEEPGYEVYKLEDF